VILMMTVAQERPATATQGYVLKKKEVVDMTAMSSLDVVPKEPSALTILNAYMVCV